MTNAPVPVIPQANDICEQEEKEQEEKRSASSINLFVAQLSFLEIDNVELARQITLIEEAMWRAIQPWELLDKAWTSNSAKNAPNVGKMTDWFNQLSLWTQGEVLTAVKSKKRTRVLTKMIDLIEVRNI